MSSRRCQPAASRSGGAAASVPEVTSATYQSDPAICRTHHLVEVAGVGLRCWSCGLPGGSAAAPPSLTALAKHFKTDKAGAHKYTQHYQKHLRPWRDKKFNLLEIGIGGYARDGQGGASLRMWKAFFPQAQILGLDIEDKSFVDEHRIRTYQGSQVDESILTSIVADVGEIGGHHRRWKSSTATHPRDVQDLVPAARGRRHVCHRGHSDVVLARVPGRG
jgi:hypothetical protein